jgi:hypothetical protein
MPPYLFQDLPRPEVAPPLDWAGRRLRSASGIPGGRGGRRWRLQWPGFDWGSGPREPVGRRAGAPGHPESRPPWSSSSSKPQGGMIHHSYCTSIAPGEPPAASRRSPPPAHPGLAGCKSSRARWVAQGDTPASQAGHHLTGGALAGMSSRVLLEEDDQPTQLAAIQGGGDHTFSTGTMDCRLGQPARTELKVDNG